jgi:3-oxoadipate enol-lactonase
MRGNAASGDAPASSSSGHDVVMDRGSGSRSGQAGPRRPALVFLHSLGSSGRCWRPQVAAFSDRCRVLAPDLPGHGGAPGPFTFERAVHAVWSALGEDEPRAHLVGISGGAIVAMLACLARPERVAGLVLSAGAARAPRIFSIQRAMVAVSPEPLLERLFAREMSGGRQEYVQIAREDLRRCGKHTFRAALGEVAKLDVRDRLSEISAPTLVLCGSRDRANLAPSRELAQGIPIAELRIIDGAGHIWNLQLPELFNQTTAEAIAHA